MSTLNTSAVKGTPRIALSQPGSRSTSPTPKFSYLTHTAVTPNKYNQIDLNNSENNGDLALTPNGYGTKSNLPGSRSANTSFSKSKIPTSSRNSSRESSPGRRSNYGSERRSSLSKMGTPGRRLFGRQLTNNSDSEQALASAMSHKYVTYILYSSKSELDNAFTSNWTNCIPSVLPIKIGNTDDNRKINSQLPIPFYWPNT
jgi:hypothetical protein